MKNVIKPNKLIIASITPTFSSFNFSPGDTAMTALFPQIAPPVPSAKLVSKSNFIYFPIK